MSFANDMSCPVCGKGHIQRHLKREEFECKGWKKTIDNCPVFVCDGCDEDFITAVDAKSFDEELTAFQREVDGYP